MANSVLVHCYCKTCNGILRSKRTEQRHRAAAKELGKPQYLPKFSDWKNSNGKAANKRGSDSTGNGETESDSSESDSDSVSHSGSDSDSEISKRPAKRPRLLAQMDVSTETKEIGTCESHIVGAGPGPVQQDNTLIWQESSQEATTSSSNKINDLEEQSNTSNLHMDSESEEDRTLNEPDSDSENSLDGSDDEGDAALDRQSIATRLAHLEMEDSQPFAGETLSEDSQPQDTMSRIENIKFTQGLIQKISNATLDDDKLDADVVEELRNPTTEPVDISDPDIRLSLDLFMACDNTSEATYAAVRTSILRRFPEANILSFYSSQKLVSKISGVCSIFDDMCINSCTAFVGPLSDTLECPECGEARYNAEKLAAGKKFPRQQACTIPLGPQLQALRRSPEAASALSYSDRKTKEVIDVYLSTQPADRVYDDIFCGSNVRELLGKLSLTADDVTVSFSVDGAQLYQNKKSDTWIGIWIINNYDPKTRFKRKHVLPALVVPGPNKPKNLDSFLFRSMYHVAALQHENNGAGMAVWDAFQRKTIQSRVVFFFGTADAVGLPELDGRVGHHGAQGCRMSCDMKGRHKPSSGHYCAAHLRPNNSEGMENCNHPDYDFRQRPTEPSSEKYLEQLNKVTNSKDQAGYERNRKLTGISKPSILSGLDANLMLSVPQCFTVDLMHLLFLNLGELLIPLWRGTLRCDQPDDKSTWDWATLTGQTWLDHGKLVALATQYFPSSFHRPPRNPAEKISSGYKATEYFLYLFGLGPAFFRVILPKVYWKNFCRLVHGVRIIIQRSITGRQLREAHSYLTQFVEEYENLYYQRRIDRLHFCRPCLHTLLHASPECVRVGPGICTSQFTMERTIGDLGSNIRQPSNIYGNLARIAVRRSQLNALKHAYPEMDSDATQSLPQNSRDFGDGFVFLRPRDRYRTNLKGEDLAVIDDQFDLSKLRRWGRLKLPNGQVARSIFSEKGRIGKSRISRNVKIKLDEKTEFAEVKFFFLIDDNSDNNQPIPYALVSLYGPPNEDLLEDSFHSLWACAYRGDSNLKVVKVSSILSVVSMQPLPKLPGEDDIGDLWFVVEKSGLDDTDLTGYVDPALY